MEKTQVCHNCEAEFTVYEKEEQTSATFCPFCGEEMLEEDTVETVSEEDEEHNEYDWDDQDRDSF